jgi:hypothetical protein
VLSKAAAPGRAVEFTDVGLFVAQREDIHALADQLAKEELLEHWASFRKDTTGNDNTIWLCAHELGQREVCALHSSTGFGLHAGQTPGAVPSGATSRVPPIVAWYSRSTDLADFQPRAAHLPAGASMPGRPDASG